MATTKLWHISGNLRDVIDYAENPEKTCPIPDLEDLANAARYVQWPEATADGQFVTGINCLAETAVQQMQLTKEQYHKTGGYIAWHGYQSFKPGEVTPEECHQIGVETAQHLWGDRFQVFVTTHLDRHHLHNHFILNSVSFVDGKKYNCSKQELYFMREVSDYHCRRHSLSVIPIGHKAASRPVHFDEKDGRPTRYNVYREDILEAFHASFTIREAEAYLRRLGYITDFTSELHFRIRLPQYKHFTRLDTLNPNWVPERMHELLTWYSRDVRRAQVRQPELPEALRSVFRPHGKPSHIYRLYLYYCYQLGILPKGTTYKPNSPFLREELRRLDQIDRETRFLTEHRIETIDELNSVMEDTQTELDRLTAERQTLRNKLRRADPAEKDILRTRKNEITAAILPLRERLKLCSGIESRSLHMQETMDLVYNFILITACAVYHRAWLCGRKVALKCDFQRMTLQCRNRNHGSKTMILRALPASFAMAKAIPKL